jgi:hypothetical protein
MTMAMVGLFVMVGLTSGLWIQMAIMAVTFGIFFATVSLRRAERPQPSGGRVISLGRYGLDSVEDLDEVA